MSTPAAATTKRSGLTTIILGIAIAAIVLLVLFLFTVMFGNVTGTEFAAHNFKTRNYHVLRIPLINIQVWPAQRVDEVSPLVDHLFGKEKFLTEVKPADPEFDLVGELAVLARFEGTPNSYKTTLSMSRPPNCSSGRRATLNWQRFFGPKCKKSPDERCIRRFPRCFTLLSKMIRLSVLKAALHQHLAAQYTLIGQAEYEQGEIGPAIVLLEEAKMYAPQDQELEKLLSEVKSKAEKKEKKSG